MLRSRAHIGKMDSFFRERIYVVEQSCSSECTILTILYIMMTPIIQYQETGLDPLLSYSRAFDVPLEGKSIATSRWANFLKIEPELKKNSSFFTISLKNLTKCEEVKKLEKELIRLINTFKQGYFLLEHFFWHTYTHIEIHCIFGKVKE